MADNVDSKASERRQTIRWNFKISNIDAMLSNVAVGMVTPFIPVFAIALGGSNTEVGLLTAVPAFINMLMYLPAASFVERGGSRLKITIRTVFIARLLYLAMAAIPFVPWPQYRTAMLIGILGVQTIPNVIVAVAWTALLGDMFPQEERAHLFAMRNMYSAFVALLSSLAAGVLLDRIAYPANYVALFSISFVTGMAALHYCGKLVEGPIRPRPTCRRSVAERLRQPFADPMCGRKFSVFAISAALLHLGINIAVPAYSIYHVRTLHLSNSVIGTLSLAAGLTTVLAYPVWGRVSRRAGHSVVYLLSILAYAPFPALYGMHGSVTYLLALQAAIGFFNAGFALTILNLTLQHVNPEDSANGIAVFNMLINSTGVLGPPLAAFVVSRYGVTSAFVLSTIVRAVGCIVYIGASGIGDTLVQLHKTLSPSALRRRRLNRKTRGVL